MCVCRPAVGQAPFKKAHSTQVKSFQLSTSKVEWMTDPLSLDCTKASGKKYALLIGINYIGHDPGQLSGCWNDVSRLADAWRPL